jgi:glycosyltransferase involved in cell wall biosynthesis
MGPTSPPPTVTVLIAAYNAGAFLERAVQSALAQSLGVLELLIVDDASTDDTVRVVKRLQTTDSRIKLISLARNGGPSAARNAGLDAAQGQWVAVLDADDAYLPNRLEQMLTLAVLHGADVVVDNFQYFDARTNSVGRAQLEPSDDVELVPFEVFLQKARPYTGETDWGLLKPIFRKQFLDDAGLRYPLRSRHGEDFLLLVEAFLHGARYLLTRKVGYLYTGRASGLSRTSIDYPLMVQHTEGLLTDPRISQRPLLIRRLEERASALKRLSLEYDFDRTWRGREYYSVARRALVERPFRAILGQRVLRKLRNGL